MAMPMSTQARSQPITKGGSVYLLKLININNQNIYIKYLEMVYPTWPVYV